MIFGKVTAQLYFVSSIKQVRDNFPQKCFIYNITMRDIFEFNHIDQTLSKEKVKILKDLYAYYHKKHYGYEKLHRGFRRKNFVCNLSAGKLIISAAVAGGITLNPVVIATLSGVGLILKAVASLKKYDKKKNKQILPVSNTKKALMRFAFTSVVKLSTKKSFLID